MRAILESDRPILVVDVQRIICALSIHCCLTLAACDRPTAAPPSPVGTWESRQQSEPPYLFTRLELKADGSFQRVSGAMPSSREESVIDSLGGNWKVAVVKSDGNDVANAGPRDDHAELLGAGKVGAPRWSDRGGKESGRANTGRQGGVADRGKGLDELPRSTDTRCVIERGWPEFSEAQVAVS